MDPIKRGRQPGRHRLRRHRAHSRRRYLTAIVLLASAIVLANLAQGANRHSVSRPTPTVTPTVTETSWPTVEPDTDPATLAIRPASQIDVDSVGFLSWAYLDRPAGLITGSDNLDAPSDTMSMVKAWLAADYLRALAPGETPPLDRLAALTLMIRDSDNTAAIEFYELVGRQASIERLIRICGLTESQPYGDLWSQTVTSARDAVRMGVCLADGRAAGPRWTAWLLDEMRLVRGVGDFGVRRALSPDLASRVAIKNGWLLRDEDDEWHIACLAIGPGWVLSVLARYPAELGFEYGTDLCRRLGGQVLAGR